MTKQQKRPKFLNLLQIHLPVTGVNSIAHRISGFLLFLSLPFWVYGFNLSLRDAHSHQQFLAMLQSPILKLFMTLLAWAIGHHLLAGVRFLLAELDVGTTLSTARQLAWLINIAGLLVLLFSGYCIWL